MFVYRLVASPFHAINQSYLRRDGKILSHRAIANPSPSPRIPNIPIFRDSSCNYITIQTIYIYIKCTALIRKMHPLSWFSWYFLIFQGTIHFTAAAPLLDALRRGRAGKLGAHHGDCTRRIDLQDPGTSRLGLGPGDGFGRKSMDFRWILKLLWEEMVENGAFMCLQLL